MSFMVTRARRLRLRRQLKMRQRQMVTLGDQADRYFIRRLDHLVGVRRFVAAWLTLIILLAGCTVAQIYSLNNYYQKLQPAPGGTYNEGVVGAFTNANPIYASNAADRTVSRLVFAGLLTYNNHNQLVGDLAERWESDARGDVYTVHLRPNLTWHDGQPLTADDVVFTYKVIQNPDAQSPLNASYQGVVVKALNPTTVTFTLANPLASFPHSLTTGIIPKHILSNIPMADMRSAGFNTARPIGAGPFKWQDVTVASISGTDKQLRISMKAFDKFHSGRPKLDYFSVKVFSKEEQMIASYKNHELQAMAGLGTDSTDLQGSNQYEYNFPQTAAVMTFFKTSGGVLSDKAVRQALVQAADTVSVRKQFGYPTNAVDEPLLKGQVGYDKTLRQLPYNLAAASKVLADNGWTDVTPGSVRQKGGQKLQFTLTAENTTENASTSKILQKSWRSIGVDANVQLVSPSELQVALAGHDYDALLRGVSIGSDPDVFVYWHSSQADVLARGRLNLSEYKSKIADEALEQGRTRVDPTLRATKYKPFLAAWRDDAPALGLYQPRFLYVTRQPVYGLRNHELNTASDRFNDVQNWMVRRVKTNVD